MRARATPANLPRRQTAFLHAGRVSQPGAIYFVTTVTAGRQNALADPAVAQRIATELHALHTGGDCQLVAATIMPDHFHFLFVLGERLPVGRLVAKLKNRTRDDGAGSTRWRWQGDFFEHRLRAHEHTEDYARYIFLNPYRAGLLPTTATWPWWSCAESARFEFTRHLNPNGGPPAEWLRPEEGVGSSLSVGE